MIVDAQQRKRAISPDQSFAVTAPAGSGKTELLTQRLLSLLATVEQPENILAITFTRKAVAEMRDRVMRALLDASQLNSEQIECLPEHRRDTLQLASRALDADAKLQWRLLDNPARLRIYTFDAFSASLARQMPVSSQFGGTPQQSDAPQEMYETAVREVLSAVGRDSELAAALEVLLRHLDCKAGRLQELLLGLLAKREQWRTIFSTFSDTPEAVMQKLEYYLQQRIETVLEACYERLVPFEAELCELMQFASDNLETASAESTAGDVPASEQPAAMRLPACKAEALSDWKRVAAFLLVKDQKSPKFLSKVNKSHGFPPKTTKPKPIFNSADFIELVNKIKSGSDELSASELAQTFNEIRELPLIATLQQQSELIQALLRVVRMTLANLEVVFQQRQQVDFAATSLQALMAIDGPTDVAMRLDYNIKHVLIDEFQDTSQLQYDLLSALCKEWQSEADSERSLFVVGDAMQSIYSFRNARVGLFMHVREHGLAGTAVEEIKLQSNFRSTASILNWVNHSFGKIFPKKDDLANGASAYVESFSSQSSDESQSHVQCFEYPADSSRLLEALKICALVKQAQQQDPGGSIAVLVRNRSAAQHLFPAFRAAGIDCMATDFERLNRQAAVADLMSLTRILLIPSDPIGWYALLRSPLLALSLADLLAVSLQQESSVWLALQAAIENAALSPDGQQRAIFFASAYRQYLQGRKRKVLEMELKGLWQALGGELLYSSSSDQQFAGNYLHELCLLLGSNPDLTWEDIQTATEGLYAQASAPSESCVQVMTMHKAKGLEFDTVILPALDKVGRAEDSELLSWYETSTSTGEPALLLGMLEPGMSSEASCYRYVRKLKDRQRHNELARLLYVACTRAAKRLYIFRGYTETAEGEAKSSAASSLAGILWPNLPESAERLSAAGDTRQSDAAHNSAPQRPRLSDVGRKHIEGISSTAESTVPQLTVNNPESQLEALSSSPSRNLFERSIGTVVHRSLEQKVTGAEQNLDLWKNAAQLSNAGAQRSSWLTQLRQLGVKQNLDEAIEWITEAMDAVESDSEHQWLFDPSLSNSATELELRILKPGSHKAIRSIVIDRTLVDEQGRRWIIDYKVHLERQVSADQLQSLAESYREQLEKYQAAFKEPCTLAVYFVLQQTLCTL